METFANKILRKVIVIIIAWRLYTLNTDNSICHNYVCINYKETFAHQPTTNCNNCINENVSVIIMFIKFAETPRKLLIIII